MADVLLASVFSPEESINGNAQNDLGDIWWQTFFGLPSDQNALLYDDSTDPDGADGSSEKASLTRLDDIQLLAGVLNESGTAKRSIVVPGGSVFFFPILNGSNPGPYVDSNGNLAGGIGGIDEKGNPITEAAMRAELDSMLGNTELISNLNVSIDGVVIPDLFSYRQQSNTPFFYALPEGNISGVPATKPGESFGGVVADGYWAGIGNLSPENHVLKFGAALEFNPDNPGPDFVLDITYNISFNLNQVRGTNSKDTTHGTNDWDEICGLNGQDYLVGRKGNDALYGGNGPDTLVGVNPDTSSPGQGEIDILNGDHGPDTYVLGDRNTPYYVGQELKDYAIIRSFSNEDIIQLKKGLSYQLDTTMTLGGRNGTSIFLESGGTRDLIGFVEGTTNLSLVRNDFVFV